MRYSSYYEPFLGGGAVFFHLQPQKAIVNYANSELINLYRVIRHDVGALIEDLKKHKNEPEYFYDIRALDRSDAINNLSPVERASRIVYLNKTCFNGLYRVNSAGAFNTPFGRYKQPNIVNEPLLKAVNVYLNTGDIQILSGDYEDALRNVPADAFVYLDPPYHPVSGTANFTGYVQGGWNEIEQIRLRSVCSQLNERGVRFLLSNSATDLIKDLYAGYSITVIRANRSVNSDGAKRGGVDELLIRNYG